MLFGVIKVTACACVLCLNDNSKCVFCQATKYRCKANWLYAVLRTKRCGFEDCYRGSSLTRWNGLEILRRLFPVEYLWQIRADCDAWLYRIDSPLITRDTNQHVVVVCPLLILILTAARLQLLESKALLSRRFFPPKGRHHRTAICQTFQQFASQAASASGQHAAVLSAVGTLKWIKHKQ